MSDLSLSSLQLILKEFSERYRQFSSDDIFTLWFLRAYVTSSEQQAAEAVVGGAGDKSHDAIFIDDAAKTIFVVQAKYRNKLSAKSESRNDLIGFAHIAHQLGNPSDAAFTRYTEKMDEFTAGRAASARRRILKDSYRLHLFFVTLGKVSETQRQDAEAIVRRAKYDSAIEVIDGRRVMVIFRDYLDGVAPPVPVLDLEMEQVPKVRVNAISNRFDETNDIKSWVFSMRGDAVGSMFEIADIRLFARNIRGFFGKKNSGQ